MQMTNDEEVRREVITAMPEIIGGDAVPKVKREQEEMENKRERVGGLGLAWMLLRGTLTCVLRLLFSSLPDSSTCD